MHKTKSNPLKRVLAAACLLLLVAALAAVYAVFSEKPVSGSKSITISVINSAAQEKTYPLHTDAQFLRQAMDECESLAYSGTEGPYGEMIDTVNGERADYTLDGAYWSFSVNGQYCNYGIDQQPVEDGDAFTIAYTR
ncbi:MAG: DUF4430 domain-containing protein [Clostridia bacterium]|nr:DUF4430 domain-containing protein [Clostridia bacterium]